MRKLINLARLHHGQGPTLVNLLSELHGLDEAVAKVTFLSDVHGLVALKLLVLVVVDADLLRNRLH